MKRIFILSVIALVAMSCSCNVGYTHDGVVRYKDVITRNESLSSFDGISCYLPYDIKVVQGNKSSISIVGPKKFVDNISINVRNGRLYLNQEEQHFVINFGSPHVTIVVTTPSLQVFELCGSGDASIYMGKQPNMYIKVTGSGDLALNDFACNGLKANITGSGDMNCKSLKCETAEIDVSGSGDFGCNNLVCKNISASVSGSGDLSFNGNADSGTFHVSGSGDINAKQLLLKDLNATVNGSGDISCNAVNIQKSVNGSGDLTNYHK